MSERNSSFLPIVGAIVFALLAAAASYFYLEMRARALMQKEGPVAPEVMVLVPKMDLQKGAVLGLNNLTQRPIAQDLAHDDVLFSRDFDSIEGRLLVQPVGRGRPLLRSFVESSGAVYFSDTINAGKRGITVQIDEINSFDGMLRPGDRVDLYLRLDQDDLPASMVTAGNEEDVLMPVMQDLLVLATGTEAHGEFREKYGRLAQQRRGDGYSTITVDVTPKEGALLSTAEEQGELVAMLRNRRDRSLADFEKVEPSDLFAHAAEMAEKAAQQKAAMSNKPLSRDDIIVNPDGTLSDKFGNPILGPDGKPLTRDDVVFNPDGSLAMKGTTLTGADGQPLSMEDVTVGADGILRDKEGNPILGPDGQPLTEDDVVINPDGTISTRGAPVTSGTEQVLTADEITIGEDGILYDENGNPILGADGQPLTRDDVVFNEDGTISEKGPTLTGSDGQPLSVNDVTVGADGMLLDENGNPILGPDGQPLTKDDVVFNADGTISVKGPTVSTGGESGPAALLGGDGKPLSADDIQVGDDGIVRDRNGNPILGPDGKPLTAADIEVDENGNVVMRSRAAAGEITAVEFLAGGSSKGGIAEVGTMPVLD